MEFNFKVTQSIDQIQEEIYKCFTSFCVLFLKIEQPFNLYLVNKNHDIDMTLAAFNVKNNDIYVRNEDRFFYDVCRSIAHELVHLQQKQEERLNLSEYTDIGGQVEDEANAVAGQICKTFVKKFNCKWIYMT